MKAVVYSGRGPAGALVYREVEKPAPDDGEVLVKIHAVSVNAADYRSMSMGIIPKNKIFGADIAGQVEAAGKNARRFQPGDAVMGDISKCGFGGFAEYAAVPESALIPIPAGVSFEDAAAVPMASVTALQALGGRDTVLAGRKVLVCGSGGGVGTFAVQLARYFGAEVTAVCSAGNADASRALGADRVIDYAKEDFSKTGGRWDLILAVNGYYPLSAYRRALNPGGACVVIGGRLRQVVKSMIFGPLMSVSGKKAGPLYGKPDTEDLRFIAGLLQDGKIKAVIDRRYPLSETAAAVRYISEGHARGKVVISILSGGK
jgi:NADPH:quinone reductase-like Zn-dependent oxidoreductase